MVTKIIGEILKDKGVLTQEQIKAASHVQEASNDVFGEILVELNFVTKDEIASAVAIQHKLEYIDLSNYVPTQKALKLVDKEFALLNTVMPLKTEGKYLVVATAWPGNDEVHEYLEQSSAHKVRFVVGNPDEIGRLIQLYYEQSECPTQKRISDMIKTSLEDEEIDIIAFSDLIIYNAIKENSSDIHIMPQKDTAHIFYRIDGVLRHYYSLPFKVTSQLLLRIKVLGKLDIAQHLQPQSGEFDFKFLQNRYNIRVSSIPTINGEKIALRIMNENFRLYTLENLGFEKELIEAISRDIQKNSGIILIVGSSGSGKTTTLYSMLRRIDILSRNVISVEEPVEHKLPFVNQVQINTRIDYTFDKALQHIGRQDPDVIVIGEILDEQTAKLAVRNSATGHLVLSTLSGSSAVRTIARLKDLNVDKYLLADGLISIISQNLLRRLCAECKTEVELSKEELAKHFKQSSDIISPLSGDTVKVYEAKGCEHCRGTGYSGRIAVVELFEVDEVVRDMIEHEKSSIEIQRYIDKMGAKSMRDNALLKVLNGLTSMDEVQRMVD